MPTKKKKNRFRILKYIVTTILMISLTIVLIGSNYLVDFALTRGSSSSDAIKENLSVSTSKEAIEREKEAEELEKQLQKEADIWAREHLTEELSVYSKDNLLLAADYFGQTNKSNKYSIILHGYHSSKEKVRVYAKKYYEQGYNVLTPDHRTHGESEGRYIGMGYLEKEDLKLWIDKIIEKDATASIILHGLSMGASTIMMAVGDGLPANIEACIEDCGYSSVWEEFSKQLYQVYGLPEFPMLYSASLVSRIKAGYFFGDASCTKALQNNKIPMLFIHGTADDYNPFYMLDIVYNANASTEKEKLEIEGARHAMSAYTEPALYWNTVWSFIAKY